MTKWIVWLLLLANLALFGWMRWGIQLTEDADSGPTQAALHPEKIKLLDLLPASAPESGSASGTSLPLSPVSAPAASASQVAPASLPEPEASAVVKSANLPSCAEWGEFSGDDLTRARAALSLLKLGDNLSQHSVEHNHGYWVYIPPMKKRANVEKKIAQLKQRGVKDYFVVQEKGKWMNAISLGVFKTKDAADKFVITLHNKDVHSAKVGERMSKLKYTVFLIKDLDSGTTDKLSALQGEFPDSKLKISACNN